jgi:hypothetical protein
MLRRSVAIGGMPDTRDITYPSGFYADMDRQTK